MRWQVNYGVGAAKGRAGQMTFDEMATFTVDGGKATCDLLGLGFVHYNFSGWRRGFDNGDGSGISFTEEFKAAEWREYEEPVKQGWAFVPDPKPVPVKRTRQRQAEPLPINDIGDWNKPEPVSVANPWLEVKQKSGWETYK